ncbi:PilZ domain-containing protein [Silvibacterium dinghuense]|nr:PilZ domain-containing protein [Silvibacterium dinghuense]
MPQSPCAERRREPRFLCEGHAEIEVPHIGLKLQGEIHDLSRSGCFIEAPTVNLERGTHVEVYFETRKICIRVAGNILVLRPRTGVGIAFLPMSPRIAWQIEMLVEELKALNGAPCPEKHEVNPTPEAAAE